MIIGTGDFRYEVVERQAKWPEVTRGQLSDSGCTEYAHYWEVQQI